MLWFGRLSRAEKARYVWFILSLPPSFYRTKRHKHKNRALLLPRLCVCLPPSLPLPLLSCDVFWPDSMAPGRQWHDHRNRGQQGHSLLFGVSRNEPGRSGSASLLTTLFKFSTEDSGLMCRLWCPYHCHTVSFGWNVFFFFYLLLPDCKI